MAIHLARGPSTKYVHICTEGEGEVRPKCEEGILSGFDTFGGSIIPKMLHSYILDASLLKHRLVRGTEEL